MGTIGEVPPGALRWARTRPIGAPPRHPPTGGGSLSLRLSIELVYDPGCPNVVRTRELLTRALQEAGLPAVWTEWSTDDDACPETHRGYGSPTVLVNGRDVAPGPHPWTRREARDGPRCRVYALEDGATSGVPPMDRVRKAVQDAMGPDAG